MLKKVISACIIGVSVFALQCYAEQNVQDDNISGTTLNIEQKDLQVSSEENLQMEDTDAPPAEEKTLPEIEMTGTGIQIIKDVYSKKVFVLDVFANSPAYEAEIPLGAEIIKINNKRVRWISAEDISKTLNGESDTAVELLIKNNKQKSLYSLKCGAYTISPENEARFLLYWNEIAPKNLYLKKIPDAVWEQLTPDYQEEVLAKQTFWQKQKTHFQTGYKACMTYPEAEQNTCLLNLVNTINNNINRNRRLNIKNSGIARQQDGIPVYNVNQIMLKNMFQNLGDRY